MVPSEASPASCLHGAGLERFSRPRLHNDPLDIRAPLALSGHLVKRISSMTLIRESWMNFIFNICVKYNDEKRSLSYVEVLSGNSEDGYNHVVSEASDIVS